MKTAIIFATSHGTTEKVARQIQEELGNDSQLFNLKETKTVDLSQYEQVVIGGSIHAGQIQGRVKKFCKQKMVDLLQKRIALYMCGMNEPDFETEFNNAYPELLRKHAFITAIVGGEFIFDRMNFLEKLIVKKVSGIDRSVSKINEGRIRELVNKLKM